MSNEERPFWTGEDIAKALNAKVAKRHVETSHFSIDTRTLSAGDVFIALQGERVDGHDYVVAAIEKGAELAIVQYLVEGVDEACQVLVEDTMDALYALAEYHRARIKAKLVGVTGSVGKTGTKEAMRLVLATQGKTYASFGNFNNHIGTPLCLINMPTDAEFGVFEMGMNHPGEISQLSVLVKPHLAIITTVESVHIEFFDSEEAIADAKAEIFDGMDENGIATLNADNPHFLRLRRAAEKHGLGRVISFGVNEMAMCRLMEYGATTEGSEITATICGTSVTYRLGAIGRHWALTSVAVLASAEALGCDLPKAAEALAGFREPKGRGRLSTLAWQKGELVLVDDSYNASPSSMSAAFAKMQELQVGLQDHRTVAVLGDMLELGDLSPKMHEALAGRLKEAEIDVVYCAGDYMKHLYDKLPTTMQGGYAKDAEALYVQLENGLEAGDLVLVKGSHGSRMWQLAEKLLQGGSSVGNGKERHANAV